MANILIEDPGFQYEGTKRDLARRVTEQVLSAAEGKTNTKPWTADRIFEAAKKLFTNVTLEEYLTLDAFRQHLSYWARADESRIAKVIGQHGYQLQTTSQLQSTPTALEVPEDDTTTRQYQKTEELLYPAFRSWLLSQEYRVRITASMRDRNLGTWGNPDITGIKVIENLGSREIEIVTIEAKVTERNFRHDFFEAVAHRRFANRAYFAFAGTRSLIGKANDELRYFSELYNVGVLLAILDDEAYEKLVQGQIDVLSPEEVDVYELFSPRYETRQNRWQKAFCNAIDIKDEQTLWTWGETAEA